MVRYAASAITDETAWNSATDVTGEPVPAVAGSAQNMTVSGLTPGQTYYFVIKTQDEVPNTSALSNSPSALAGPDTTAPAAITDLAAAAGVEGAANLTWTAPGDNGATGTAATYSVRYAASAITDETAWNNATDVSDEPAPAVAGSAQNMTVSGLTPGQTYYFVIKTQDEVPNTSALSNSPSALAGPDTTAPAAITNLSVISQTEGEAILTWNAPGDDGNTGVAKAYLVRYSLSPITSAAAWDSAKPAANPPLPLMAGAQQTMIIPGLTPDTTYFFAIRSLDDASNLSALSNSPSVLIQFVPHSFKILLPVIRK